jgi:hypothetical protein
MYKCTQMSISLTKCTNMSISISLTKQTNMLTSLTKCTKMVKYLTKCTRMLISLKNVNIPDQMYKNVDILPMLKSRTFHATSSIQMHGELCLTFNLGWYEQVLELYTWLFPNFHTYSLYVSFDLCTSVQTKVMAIKLGDAFNNSRLVRIQ